VAWVSAIQRFKGRFLDLDGNTNLKSKAGHYGNGSSIVSSAVQFADRNFQVEKVNERYRFTTVVSKLPVRTKPLARRTLPRG
jgi:hypothetical protein